MFWVFTSFVGLMFAAVQLGQMSVWLAILKLALLAALLVIAVMGIAMLSRQGKQLEGS